MQTFPSFRCVLLRTFLDAAQARASTVFNTSIPNAPDMTIVSALQAQPCNGHVVLKRSHYMDVPPSPRGGLHGMLDLCKMPHRLDPQGLAMRTEELVLLSGLPQPMLMWSLMCRIAWWMRATTLPTAQGPSGEPSCDCSRTAWQSACSVAASPMVTPSSSMWTQMARSQFSMAESLSPQTWWLPPQSHSCLLASARQVSLPSRA